MGCLLCPYIARQKQWIQHHCRTQHNWINPTGRFGIPVDMATNQPNQPWRTDIRCQRLFQSRRASGWFEVERNMTQDLIQDSTQPGGNGRFQQLQQRIEYPVGWIPNQSTNHPGKGSEEGAQFVAGPGRLGTPLTWNRSPVAPPIDTATRSRRNPLTVYILVWVE